MMVTRSVPMYTEIYLRGTGGLGNIKDVIKGTVSVCGDETINLTNPDHGAFDINLNVTEDSQWTSFDMRQVFNTTSPLRPDNDCPIYGVYVYKDSQCSNKAAREQAYSVRT
jgi:hypothetical protein